MCILHSFSGKKNCTIVTIANILHIKGMREHTQSVVLIDLPITALFKLISYQTKNLIKNCIYNILYMCGKAYKERK